MISPSFRNSNLTSNEQCQTANANDLSPLRAITDDFKELFDFDHQSWPGVSGFDSPDLQAVKGNSKWNSPGTIGMSRH